MAQQALAELSPHGLSTVYDLGHSFESVVTVGVTDVAEVSQQVQRFNVSGWND